MRIRNAMVVVACCIGGVSFSVAEEPIRLFNGKDLSGWTHYLWSPAGRQDTETPAGAVWKVEEGVLICKGRPIGYLQTKGEFENYRLVLQWRFPPGGEGGNSGVLVHTTSPNAIGPWPKSIEVQLFRKDAGDFWVIGTDLDVENEAERKKGRRFLNLTDDSEKPFGEWNTMEITCQGSEIRVKVNGDAVNHATNCSARKGAICLQSEGAEIHFRDIVLTPLK